MASLNVYITMIKIVMPIGTVLLQDDKMSLDLKYMLLRRRIKVSRPGNDLVSM